MFDLGDAQLCWLSSVKANDEFTSIVGIQELAIYISKTIEENPKSVILLDGMEYLVSDNDFTQVLKFVRNVRDKISTSESKLLIPVNSKGLEQKQLILLERECQTIYKYQMMGGDKYVQSGPTKDEAARRQKSFDEGEDIPLPDKFINDKLNDRLGKMGSQSVVLISPKSENYGPVLAGALDILINRKRMGGVYVSVTKPAEFVIRTMTAAQTPSDDVYFVDCISGMTAGAHEKNEQVAYVENPSSLEEVSMYINRMLAKVKSHNKFIFLDSLSSLLIYNNDKSVREFTHFLINKVRVESISGIILSIEKKEAEDLVKTLTPMCDMEVRF
jgi:archaellum biogenesis ATPase FlaH